MFSTKVNLPYLLYSIAWMCYLLHLIKQNCWLNFLLRTLILMTQVYDKLFLFKYNLKLHNTSVIHKLLKKVITKLDSSMASGPDCMPVVVLKSCDPELLYILAELFNMCLKESCFPDRWKVLSLVLVFKNVGERPTTRYCHTVSLFICG